MPDYSEYIIKENNEIKVFANRRGDYTFIADVFLGPNMIKEFINRQFEQKDSIGDNAFSAIVLDYDKKDLLIEMYPSEDSDGTGIFTIEILLELLEIRYPKWNVKYAQNGMLDRIKYLSNGNTLLTFGDYDKDGWDEPRGTLISVDQNDKQTVLWNELSLYELIPKGAEYVMDSDNHESVPQNRFPFGGIHLDISSTSMFFWYSNPTPLAEKWAQEYWSQFNILFEFNGYRNHFDVIKEPVFVEIINASRKTAVERLKHSTVFSYEEHSKFRLENDRYNEELKIHSVLERQSFFEKALNEIKTVYINK